MKSKRTFFISLFSACLLLCQVSYAEVISLEKAQIVAKNLYFERVNLVKENVSFQSIKFENAIVISRNSMPMYYAFNCASEVGFVIVSAESNAMPILAYSFETNFNPANLNESVAETMNNFENEITAIRDNNLPADVEIIKAWAKYSSTAIPKSGNEITTVGPLVKTSWDQSCYYNTLCPAASNAPYGYCNHVPSGCVSIIMAQLMKFWSYPSTGIGSNSYSSMGSHSVNFAAQTYNWSAMPLSLTTENAEVAKIIYHSGVSVNMSYTSNGSSAVTQVAAEKLIYNFKYSTTTQYVLKSSYSNINWHILIRSNLINGRPVPYSGREGQNGHAFIVDGFQYPEYYHVNWGWGGSNNGYFYLNALNSGNGNWNTAQGAIINCYPANIVSNPMGIEENISSNGVKISPNPNNGNFSLLINNAIKGNINITIMDITSRVILKKTIQKEDDVITEEMMLPELTKGFYFVTLEGNQYKSMNKFIVK